MSRAARHAPVSLLLLLLLLLALASPAPAAAVTVLDTRGPEPFPCPPVDTTNPHDLGGGCTPLLVDTDVHVTLRTMVGDVDLGTCQYRHFLHIDGSGRTYMELIQAFADGPQGCSDFEGCMIDDPKPWEGRIEVDRQGNLHNRVSACFDTCMGQFRGELVLSLSRTRRGWRETVSDDQAGASGLEVDGHWDFDFDGIEIRRDDGASAGDGPAAGASGTSGSTPDAGSLTLDRATPFVLWPGGADMHGAGAATGLAPATALAAATPNIRPPARN